MGCTVIMVHRWRRSRRNGAAPGRQEPRRRRQRVGHAGQPLQGSDTSVDRDAGASKGHGGREHLPPGLHHGGAGDSAGHGGFLFDNVIFPLLLRKVYTGKDRQEAIVKKSRLAWVLVRPSILNNKPGRGTIKALEDLSDFHGGCISRQDVAKFVLDQLSADVWLRRTPLITS